MVFLNDKKFACQTCIKGHRSSGCRHTDRPLFEIKKKGRPITQCDHCRELRKTKQVHVRCQCDSREDPHLPGSGKRVIGPIAPAFPNGLVGLKGESNGESDARPCLCKSQGECTCCTPRKPSKQEPTTPTIGSSPLPSITNETTLYLPNNYQNNAHNNANGFGEFPMSPGSPYCGNNNEGAQSPEFSSPMNSPLASPNIQQFREQVQSWPFPTNSGAQTPQPMDTSQNDFYSSWGNGTQQSQQQQTYHQQQQNNLQGNGHNPGPCGCANGTCQSCRYDGTSMLCAPTCVNSTNSFPSHSRASSNDHPLVYPGNGYAVSSSSDSAYQQSNVSFSSFSSLPSATTVTTPSPSVNDPYSLWSRNDRSNDSSGASVLTFSDDTSSVHSRPSFATSGERDGMSSYMPSPTGSMVHLPYSPSNMSAISSYDALSDTGRSVNSMPLALTSRMSVMSVLPSKSISTTMLPQSSPQPPSNNGGKSPGIKTSLLNSRSAAVKRGFKRLLPRPNTIVESNEAQQPMPEPHQQHQILQQPLSSQMYGGLTASAAMPIPMSGSGGFLSVNAIPASAGGFPRTMADTTAFQPMQQQQQAQQQQPQTFFLPKPQNVFTPQIMPYNKLM